jgi:hypothetical protein
LKIAISLPISPRPDKVITMRRRVRFAVIVLVSQILLIAVTMAWLVHMTIIAVNKSVLFVERSPWILWGEIIAALIIIMFGTFTLVLQIQRLGERRDVEKVREATKTGEPSVRGADTETRVD